MAEQKKAEWHDITEDDVSEIRQDINKFRFELVEILRKNNFDVGNVRKGDGNFGGRRAKQMERRILKVRGGRVSVCLFIFIKTLCAVFTQNCNHTWID